MPPSKTDSSSPSYAPAPANGSPWFAISLCLMGLIVGYGLASFQMGGVARPTIAQGDDAGTPPPAAPETPPTVDDDEVLGDEDATITLVEFTDYQCPFCQRHFQQTYGQIKKDYIDTGKVKLVVRDYPLSFHPHAQKAAEASECAGDQGKFWEMHDKLFGSLNEWSNAADAPAMFKKYAADMKLDTGDFDSCLDNGDNAEEVRNDLADGSASGISGTPGFWILGPDGQNQKISGAYPYETFKTAFDELL
jgi:protein-disulfide isomerase